ncbi:MAG: NADH-quinone oxidoreductase subunit D [Actinomycetales bacterium]|nr:NADH-quinone oxidoreductase subunit D [Actinomycetales bacterium]
MPSAPVPARVLAATGPVALTGDVQVHPIVLPPGHPAGHGSLRLTLEVDTDGRISAADPLGGLLHRGAEKLFEVRDYRQILALANRHDWLGGFSGELTIARVVEEALGLDAPERAVWLRTILGELDRIHSHLTFLGAAPGGPSTALAREAVLQLVEDIAGSRMHPMLVRLGGLREDAPVGWEASARHTCAVVRSELSSVTNAFADLALEHRGLGVLTRESAAGFGASGPVARAAGLAHDVRGDDAYAGYGRVWGEHGPGRVVHRSTGDVAARYAVLLEEVAVALDLVLACLDRLTPGPVNVRLPKVVRVPEGQWYAVTESPLGRAGALLVSRGGPQPWRLALRTPSFGNVAALSALLPGTMVTDLATVVASVPFVMGDLDK